MQTERAMRKKSLRARPQLEFARLFFFSHGCRSRLPWVPKVFSSLAANSNTSRTDMTDSGNRARKTSGTPGISRRARRTISERGITRSLTF